MWIIVLILLAIAAYFITQAMRNKGDSTNADATSSGSIESQATSQGSIEAGGSPASDSASDAASDAANGAVSNAASGAVSAVAGGAAAVAASAAGASVRSDDPMLDVREMLKILNLRDSDASRLGINKEQYNNLKTGDAANLSADQVKEVADRLESMLS